jgi:elongation factor Ts
MSEGKSSGVNIEQIKALRERTGAGIMECRKALEEASGQMEEAIRLLKARGAAFATSKADRAVSQGLIGGYVHSGRIGVLVEVNCETDFVARTDLFKQFVHDLCLQIASMNPRFVHREDVPQDWIAQELEQLHDHLAGVDEEASQPMQQAHMEAFYREHVLLDQPFVKDPSKTVQDLLHEVIRATGENIVIRRFVRMILGETGPSTPSGSGACA